MKVVLYCGQENAWKNPFSWCKALPWVLVLQHIFCNSKTQQLVPTETEKGLATHWREGGWWAGLPGAVQDVLVDGLAQGTATFKRQLQNCWIVEAESGSSFYCPCLVCHGHFSIFRTTEATLTYSATKWGFSEECRDERPAKAICHPAFKPLTACGNHKAVEGQRSLKRTIAEVSAKSKALESSPRAGCFGWLAGVWVCGWPCWFLFFFFLM